jgi:hypothetical protein
MFRSTLITVSLLSLVCIGLAQTREQTTIQTAKASVKDKSDAIAIKYLNLPWGEKTFEYLEKGTDEYYSTRSWPFARIIVGVPVHINDHSLTTGNYALVLTPAKKGQPMVVSVIRLNDEKEFMQPGNIFVEVPAGKTLFSEPANFQTMDQASADHMKATLDSDDKGVTLNIVYGNRKFSRLITID